MTKEEFLEKFSKDVLQLEETVSENVDLLELSAWDSLAEITTIAFADKELGVKLTFEELRSVNNLQDIIIKLSLD